MTSRLLLLTLLWTSNLVAQEPSTSELALRAQTVLRTNCSRCHRGAGSEGGEFDLLKHQDLLDHDLIEPGKVDDSTLLRRIRRGEMPPKPARLLAEEAEAIRQWIAAGAPAFNAEESARTEISSEQTARDILSALRAARPKDRPFLRFFSLVNLYNDPRVRDADLQVNRAALAKTVNSLSWKSRIVVPQAIDEANTLYQIDVRDFDWDRTRGWDRLMRSYPYGVEFDSTRHKELYHLHEEIHEATGCVIPVLRVDWFVATATRPPLYYDILQIPHVAADLERELGVDIARNFENPTAARISRGGFARSGVSGQNRLVERHDSKYGYYWKSYDFRADSPRGQLVRLPLGPRNLFPAGKHPFDDLAFEHDGGEIIFSLPNGLQAYMLIDGRDQRIDVGPIEVVGDSLKTSGTHAIVNGVSCMSCHRHGMISFQDTVRGHAAVFGDAEKQVERLFPPVEAMDQLLEEDETRFKTALRRTIGEFIASEGNRPTDAELANYPEPVGELARAYRLGFVDLRMAAAEIGAESPEEIIRQVGRQRMKELGLEPLLLPGGVVPRLQWETGDGISLMQELARDLGFTPWR
ncbi:MAG: hypothetical protein KDA75_08865 [Planctomycetaceae bacterium]|nr:hypothetical protein [Planctomycetaceae bacterium]